MLTEHLGVNSTIVHMSESSMSADFEYAVYHIKHHTRDINFVGKYAMPRLPRKLGYKCVLTHEGSEDHFAHRRAPWTVVRHEQAQRAIGTALATVEGVQVHLKPLITGTQRRNDIRITRSAASGLSSEDIDITIVSLASQDSQTATLPLATTEDDSTAERTAKLVEKHLNAVAREK
ncbi:hypothetical protein EHS25_004790 [Saitozyma podzolica]|uniref:Uncharacterized protein n=1 Tax=Saitozyma podzolica TaxID=1890683 RepID=A0A427Y2P0_9TREE|nr:hypothetical protein EHS25_004790 [Saitozyma podzolica]